MREAKIYQAHKIIKERENKENLKDFDEDVKKFVKEGSESRDIYEMQKIKLDIMDWLKETLQGVEDTGELRGDQFQGGSVSVKEGRWHLQSEDQGSVISEGQIFSDIEWGIYYQLDQSVPLLKKKQYCLEIAKSRIEMYYHEQLMKSDFSKRLQEKSFQKEHLFDVEQEQRFKHIQRFLEGNGVEVGFILESVMSSLLKKWIIDLHLPLEVIKPTKNQDTQDKVDLMLKKKKYYRGVILESTDKDTIGFQLTTNKKLVEKRSQVMRVKERIKTGKIQYMDDLILVRIPSATVMGIVKKWEIAGKKGGLHQYVESYQVQEILGQLCAELLDKQEVDIKMKEFNQQMFPEKEEKRREEEKREQAQQEKIRDEYISVMKEMLSKELTHESIAFCVDFFNKLKKYPSSQRVYLSELEGSIKLSEIRFGKSLAWYELHRLVNIFKKKT